MLSALHAPQFPLYSILPCKRQFLTELCNYILIMLLTFHTAPCYDNYFINFVTLSTYFLLKSWCNRSKTLMKNVVRYSKCLNMADSVSLFTLNWGICFLCQDSKSLYFSASTFFAAISYLRISYFLFKSRKTFWYFPDSSYK